MQRILLTALVFGCTVGTGACQSDREKARKDGYTASATQNPGGGTTTLPEPFATKSVRNFSNVVGWPDGKTPVAPPGFTVTRFASDLINPRWIYIGPNGDIFVAEALTERKGVKEKIGSAIVGRNKSENSGDSPDRILLFRDANNDGTPELQQEFATGLNQPFGMLILNGQFYIANTDGILAFPYTVGQTRLTGSGKKILSLPAGGYNNHWTRNLLASKDGKKIFVTVGSGSNVGEHGMANEIRRANVLEINPDGSGERIYASGLRNPVGAGFAPGTNTLWVAVNERDELGDDLVPDYITSVKEGGFYGWPYAYWGKHPDPRMKDDPHPELVSRTIVPDVDLGSHTASLGLAFDEKGSFPAPWKGGAFVGQHGSWNRSKISGYKVVFVPFSGGRPSGPPQDFLTGFVADLDAAKVYGRPVGVTFAQDGSLLVADDASRTIWRVSPAR